MFTDARNYEGARKYEENCVTAYRMWDVKAASTIGNCDILRRREALLVHQPQMHTRKPWWTWRRESPKDGQSKLCRSCLMFCGGGVYLEQCRIQPEVEQLCGPGVVFFVLVLHPQARNQHERRELLHASAVVRHIVRRSCLPLVRDSGRMAHHEQFGRTKPANVMLIAPYSVLD